MTLTSNKVFHVDGYFYKGNRKLFICNDPGTRGVLSGMKKCTGLPQTTVKFKETFPLVFCEL